MDIVCILNSKQASNLVSSRKSILLQTIQIACASCENISIVICFPDFPPVVNVKYTPVIV